LEDGGIDVRRWPMCLYDDHKPREIKPYIHGSRRSSASERLRNDSSGTLPKILAEPAHIGLGTLLEVALDKAA
jgi:hypothetical protein